MPDVRRTALDDIREWFRCRRRISKANETSMMYRYTATVADISLIAAGRAWRTAPGSRAVAGHCCLHSRMK